MASPTSRTRRSSWMAHLGSLSEEPTSDSAITTTFAANFHSHDHVVTPEASLRKLLFPIDEKAPTTELPVFVRAREVSASLRDKIKSLRPSSTGQPVNTSLDDEGNSSLKISSFTHVRSSSATFQEKIRPLRRSSSTGGQSYNCETQSIPIPPLKNTTWSRSLSLDPQPLPPNSQPSVPRKSRRRPVSFGGRPTSSSGVLSSALTFINPWSSAAAPVLTKDSQQEASAQTNFPALSKVESQSPRPDRSEARLSNSFSKMSLSSMLGALSLRGNSSDEQRGRTEEKSKSKSRSSSAVSPSRRDERSQSRNRSSSPFSLRRFRSREPSPAPPMPLHMEEPENESSQRNSTVRPRTAFSDDPDSGSEVEDDDDGEGWSDDEEDCDPLTAQNTEKNSLVVPPDTTLTGEADDVDLGEGVNVVVPPEPYFPSTLNGDTGSLMGRAPASPQKRKKSRAHETLPHKLSRPVFQRDRCTITITQGPQAIAQMKKRTYVVASDMSQESRYAVEWGIGTVLRDGDEMRIVTVLESDSKVDPPNAATTAIERQAKVRSQQERQGLAYILVRQATSLLQRTKLSVTVRCEAWHAKNARHMLLDIVDYVEPTMLIVGSRGLGQLKGILLGSTSHYLIAKCSVPVMVARRRLKRPAKRSAHLNTDRRHVSLAEAGIDTVVSKVDKDVETMRDEIKRDDDDRGRPAAEAPESDDEADDEIEMRDRKVAGE